MPTKRTKRVRPFAAKITMAAVEAFKSGCSAGRARCVLEVADVPASEYAVCRPRRRLLRKDAGSSWRTNQAASYGTHIRNQMSR